MENLRKTVLEQVKLGGACAVGITTSEMLAGGPESTNISRVLPGAKYKNKNSYRKTERKDSYEA